MEQIKWFKRKFDFAFEQNIFPSIIERLEGTPILLEHKIRQIPSGKLAVKYNNSWSIKENIGHLIDIEPLWEGRLDDVLSGEEYMRPADLENKKTDEAGHNETEINDLLNAFSEARKPILRKLKNLTEKQVYQFALHPRLKKPMRIMDLFLFVAEHDDHHLARITELNDLI